MELVQDITLCQFRKQWVRLACCELFQRASAFHLHLSLAMGLRSSMELWGGASINRLPESPSHCVLDNERLVHSGSWSYPNNVTEPAESPLPDILNQVKAGRGWGDGLRISVAIDRPVILASISLLVPLSLRIVFTSRFQVSYPYVSMDQTTTSYSRNLTFWEMCGESKTWRSLAWHCHRHPCAYIIVL